MCGRVVRSCRIPAVVFRVVFEVAYRVVPRVAYMVVVGVAVVYRGSYISVSVVVS